VATEILRLEPVSIRDVDNSGDLFIFKNNDHFDFGTGYFMTPSEEVVRENRELISQIRLPTIGVNKYVGIDRIPSKEVDESMRETKFEFFRVGSGMNINVPKGKIKELRFRIVLYGDGEESKNVFAISGFPNDKIKNINIVRGRIGLSVNKLLRIIPHPVSELVGNIVNMELNPWEIDWSYNKLEVGFSEAMTNRLDWYLSSENINQSFQCFFTIKKHASVKRVLAKVRAVWRYEFHEEGMKAWFLRNCHNDLCTVNSEEKEIEITS